MSSFFDGGRVGLMVTDDATTPATKQDLTSLREATKQDLIIHREATKQDLIIHREATKQDIALLATKEDFIYLMDIIGKLQVRMEEMFQEASNQTRLLIENLRYDVVGMSNDRHQQYETRFKRIEKHVGLKAT